MIGFAGPRVIKDTTQSELPPGFQTAEFLLEHGLIDAIVPRTELKPRLCYYLDYLMESREEPRRQWQVDSGRSTEFFTSLVGRRCCAAQDSGQSSSSALPGWRRILSCARRCSGQPSSGFLTIGYCVSDRRGKR